MELPYITKSIFTDITDDILVKGDFVHISTKHTTCGLRIMENEVGLLKDLESLMERFAPKDAFYTHNLMEFRDVPADEPNNGHSHMRFMLFNTSELIAVKDGMLDLGRWQRVFLVDLDVGRKRNVQVRYPWYNTPTV